MIIKYSFPVYWLLYFWSKSFISAPWVSHWLLKFESVCSWKLKIFFRWKCMKCMLEYVIENINHFCQNLFIKVRVAWKNSRRSQGVLGLTSWVCLKVSKAYLAIHNRRPARALEGGGSYWKHCTCRLNGPPNYRFGSYNKLWEKKKLDGIHWTKKACQSFEWNWKWNCIICHRFSHNYSEIHLGFGEFT